MFLVIEGGTVLKVFISSTYEDLKKYRQAAIEVMNRYEGTPLAMEFFLARTGEPKEVCKKEIKKCDIFVGIYAYRYGFIPKGEKKSITQQEYEFAKKIGKDRLCFVVKKGYQWNPDFIEINKYKKLQDFLSTVKDENVVAFFESTADFSGKFAVSLGKLISEKMEGKEPRDRVGEARPCIPFAPAPFIAHPYPLPQHFIGRDAEQALLSNWFFNEAEPILVIEAIGGMGKSALIWVWLHKQVLEPGVEIEGVFWWSFYESPFEVFIQQLACYVLGKEDSEATLLSADIAKLQAALHQRRFLLVLDGLERALRGYSGMEAMFIQEKEFQGSSGDEAEWEKRQREPVHPSAARFFPHLASSAGKTKTLITTRLMPVPLEGLAGVKHVLLKGLSPGDAVRFLRSEGIKGTRAELEQAGNIYDFHPLMLKLLASSIKRSRSKDIREAFRLNLIDSREPQKILTTGFNLLSKEERRVAASISVFRGVFTFESAKALVSDIKEDRLWKVMQELQGLGFLFYDEKQDRFDFHPIMRSFLYNRLTDRIKIHILAACHLKTLPKAKKIVSLDDLSPLIGLYHHLVKAEKFNEALELYQDRISMPVHYQFSLYHLSIELLKVLFPDGEDQLPRLSKRSSQFWTLNTLADTYSHIGQPSKTVPLILKGLKIQGKNDLDKILPISLGNVATAQLKVGKFSASITHLRRDIAFCSEIEDEYWEAICYQKLGRVLAYQRRVSNVKRFNLPIFDIKSCEDKQPQSHDYWKIESNYHRLSIEYAYRSFPLFLQLRLAEVLPEIGNGSNSTALKALEQVRKALEFAEKDAEEFYPIPRDFVRVYWLLGEILIQSQSVPLIDQINYIRISFYNEYFQEQLESLLLKNSNKLLVAERCLNEALRRCRKVNMIDYEPDLLLAQAKLEWAKSSSIFPTIEKNLEEVHYISQRAGYRLKLADLHLFCGQVLLELKEKTTLLGLNAYEHLQKTKEYALDVSEFSDLYQSPDPDFYKGIPEYEMLKRGMTHEERIQNGYWVAYKIAEELEKKCISKISG